MSGDRKRLVLPAQRTVRPWLELSAAQLKSKTSLGLRFFQSWADSIFDHVVQHLKHLGASVQAKE